MKKLLSACFHAALAVLPMPLKRFILNRFLGCDIDRTARIGLSFICVKKIKMGPGSRIGHGNIIRNLELLELGPNASISMFNRVTALPLSSQKHFTDMPERFPSLTLGAHTAIVRGNFFDCCSAISIGHYALIAGQGSAFFSHGINVEHCKQETAPVRIGDYCMVAACCVVTKGAVLPDYSLLGANSTLHKPFTETHTLYSGVPASAVKKLGPDCLFFHRETGYVS